MEKEESKEEEESRSLPICLQNLHQLHLSSVPDSALYFVSRIPLVSRERMSLLQHQTSVTGMHNHLTKSSGQGTWGVRKHLVSLPEAQNIYSTHVRSSGLTVFKWTPCTASSQDQQTVWHSTIESVVKPTRFQPPLGIFVTKLKSRTSHFLPRKLWCALVVVPLPELCRTLAFILSDLSASKFPSKYFSSSLTFSDYPPLTLHHTRTLCQMSKV